MSAARRVLFTIATLAATTGLTLGLSGPAAANTTAEAAPQHKANAELEAQCAVPPTADNNVIRIVHDVAVQRGANPKVMTATFEAGWVESHMNNLNCGDRDSLGVFQQRPSQGWGTPEQIMNVQYATNAFLDQAIPNDRENPGFTPGELAQSVQRSAYPGRYDAAYDKAQELIRRAQDL